MMNNNGLLPVEMGGRNGGGVRVDSRELMGPAHEMMRLGDVVKRRVQELSAEERQLQAQEEAMADDTLARDEIRRLKMGLAELENGLDGGSPGSWNDRVAKFERENTRALAFKDRVRAHDFEQQRKDLFFNFSNRVQASASKQVAVNARRGWDADFQASVDLEDYAGAKAQLDEGVAKGYITPRQREAQLKRVDVAERTSGFQSMVTDDPEGFLRAYNGGEVTGLRSSDVNAMVGQASAVVQSSYEFPVQLSQKEAEAMLPEDEYGGQRASGGSSGGGNGRTDKADVGLDDQVKAVGVWWDQVVGGFDARAYAGGLDSGEWRQRKVVLADMWEKAGVPSGDIKAGLELMEARFKAPDRASGDKDVVDFLFNNNFFNKFGKVVERIEDNGSSAFGNNSNAKLLAAQYKAANKKNGTNESPSPIYQVVKTNDVRAEAEAIQNKALFIKRMSEYDRENPEADDYVRKMAQAKILKEITGKEFPFLQLAYDQKVLDQYETLRKRKSYAKQVENVRTDDYGKALADYQGDKAKGQRLQAFTDTLAAEMAKRAEREEAVRGVQRSMLVMPKANLQMAEDGGDEVVVGEDVYLSNREFFDSGVDIEFRFGAGARLVTSKFRVDPEVQGVRIGSGLGSRMGMVRGRGFSSQVIFKKSNK